MLFLIRHGETEWNRFGRKQGRGDSPLTALGKRQARACGAVLKELVPRQSSLSVITSPLGRAKASAEIVAEELGVEPCSMTVGACLAEYDYGEWEGLDDQGIETRFPDAIEQRSKAIWDYVVPGGESYSRVDARVRQWLQSPRGSEFTVAITHDMVSRVLRGIYLSLPPSETLKLVHPHTCIYQLSRGDVHLYNASVGHLE